MNQAQVIAELSLKYPGKEIIKNDIEFPTEIVCKIKSTEDHPAYSLAIAVIDKSIPHVHKKSIEEYSVIRGDLILHVNNKKFSLRQGETFIIQPDQIHWAEGRETWVSCFFQPGWTVEDHIILRELKID